MVPKSAAKAGTKSGAAAAAAAAVGLKEVGKSGRNGGVAATAAAAQKAAAPKRKISIKGVESGGVSHTSAVAPCPVPVPTAEVDDGKALGEEQEEEEEEKRKAVTAKQAKVRPFPVLHVFFWAAGCLVVLHGIFILTHVYLIG